jgi:adenine-specific DNA-methyltransferase
LLATETAEAYAELLRDDTFTQLDAWGRTELGMVTGNNRYFCLSATRAAELGPKANELKRISPPGSRHLRGLTLTERAWREPADEGRSTYLFAPRADLEVHLSEAATADITEGEKAGIQKAYKCRVRSPWWTVPRVAIPDLFLTYRWPELPANQGMGDPGLEPGTSSLSEKRSNRLS